MREVRRQPSPRGFEVRSRLQTILLRGQGAALLGDPFKGDVGIPVASHKVFEVSRAREDREADRKLIHEGPSQEDMETISPHAEFKQPAGFSSSGEY